MANHNTTKAELVSEIASGTGHSKAVVEEILDDFAGVVLDRVAGGGDVSYPKLGKFKSHEQAAREGRNPATGEAMSFPSKRVLKFAPSAAAKSFVNGE